MNSNEPTRFEELQQSFYPKLSPSEVHRFQEEYWEYVDFYNRHPYTYHNRMAVFNIVRLQYERIKPRALYVGVDMWVTYARLLGGFKYDPPHSGKVGKAELSFGYNFLPTLKDQITPIGGIGLFRDFRHNTFYNKRRTYYYYDSWEGSYYRTYEHHFILPTIVYLSTGFLYNHAFNTVFNLGVQLKPMIGMSEGGGLYHGEIPPLDLISPCRCCFALAETATGSFS